MIKNTKKRKIFFVYKDEGEYKTESLWSTKKGEFYQIDNIPFFINNIAYEDIVSVEINEKELYFDRLIKESGNSTIQLVILNEATQVEVGKKFEVLGCSWEGSHLKNYIAINIPKEVRFNKIKTKLSKGLNTNLWDYKEACISNHHKKEL